MTDTEIYNNAFKEAFGVEDAALAGLAYQSIPAWDSVGHMNLISLLEDAYGIMMDTDDIIDFNSYEKGKEILARYGRNF